MLVVKVELWPGGSVVRAKEIGRVFISNSSDLADVSDYHVLADEAGEPRLGIPAQALDFEIKGHERNQSVFALLEKVFARANRPENEDATGTT